MKVNLSTILVIEMYIKKNLALTGPGPGVPTGEGGTRPQPCPGDPTSRWYGSSCEDPMEPGEGAL